VFVNPALGNEKKGRGEKKKEHLGFDLPKKRGKKRRRKRRGEKKESQNFSFLNRRKKKKEAVST